MLTETGHLYEFGDFRLDAEGKTLFCLNQPVPLTPKVFDTLQLFIENAGRLLEKDELMQRLWQDRFVEESNLTFNIKMLRRALKDDAQHPRFIETVPRRGYRFIAQVKQVSSAVEDKLTPSQKQFKASYLGIFAVIAAAIVLTVVVSLGYRGTVASAESTPIMSAPFTSEKLSSSGSVHAVITPDGEYVAYTNETGGRQSIWLRKLKTSENIQIAPPSDGSYLGLAISHDGNLLYCDRRDRADDDASAIYRLNTFGGIPAKIAEKAEGGIGVSPDDKQLTFVRCNYRPEDFCSLFVVDIDGQNERKVSTQERPTRITSSQFTKDGRSLVFAAGQSLSGGRDFRLMKVDLSSGAETRLSQTSFFVINRITPLPGDGFLFTAKETLDGKLRIWEVSASGETKGVTKDTADYHDLSLDNAAQKLIATQISNSFQLHLVQLDNLSDARVVSSARSVTFATDGRIVYSGTDRDIWSIKLDGSDQRQLINNAFNDFSPRVSPDGRTIYFASNRTGSNQIWQMNADGTNQIQVTKREGGYPQLVTPDGKYVYFFSGFTRTLWRLDVNTGEENQLTDTPA